MDKLFITILNNVIAASWMILAIIAIRFVFRKFIKKVPKWVNCLLWGLAAIRLVFPFHIESIFSLIPSASPVPTGIEYADTPQIDSGISAINTAINPVLENHFAAEEIASVNPMQVVIILASYIWIIGVAVLLIYAFLSFVLLKRQVKNAQFIDKGICRCSAIDTPFILGIMNPTIYIPDSLEEEEYLCVTEHEKAHIRRGDFFWKPLGFIILSVYWFHPLCWISYILLCRDIEYACDEKVTKDKDKEWKAKYCQTLLDCSSKRRLVSACPVAFGEVSVKDRIKSVINYKKPTFWVVIIAILTVVIVAICFMTNPKAEKIDKDAIVGTYVKNIANEDKMLYASMLSISADGTFVYNPSMISSYMGAGTWETEDDHVIFFDTGMGDTRKEVFLYHDGHLYYVADESASNSMWQLEDGAEYVFTENEFDLFRDDLERDALSGESLPQETQASKEETREEETENIDTLEEAIHQAIIEHGSKYAPASGTSEYKAASFIKLEEVLTDGTVEERYVKGMSMYMEANVTDEGIKETSCLHVPAILTFEVTDGSFLLKEYWEPGEGAYYGESIKENFLPENADIVMNSQATVYKQYMDCYDQIIRASGMNPDAIIEQLLSKICSLPDRSSNVADYIKNWPIEYRELIYYGQYTLDYYEEHSDKKDLQAAVLEEACKKIEEEIGGQEETFENRTEKRVHPITGDVKKEEVTPEDIYSIVKINLVLPDNTVQTITDLTKTGMIEKMLSKAVEVKGLDCPTGIAVSLYREDGTMLELFPSTDSCDCFQVNGRYYDWGSGDNSGFWDLLGLENKQGKICRKEYTLSDKEIGLLVRVTDHNGKEFQKEGYIVLRDEEHVYLQQVDNKKLFKLINLAPYSFDSKRGDTVEVDPDGRLLEITVDGHTKVCGLFIES